MCRRNLALALCLAPIFACAAHAQDPEAAISAWFQLKAGESGLVLVLDNASALNSATIEDASGNKLDETKWVEGFPLIRQLRLPAGKYKIEIPPNDANPVVAIEVQVKEGAFSNLQLNSSQNPPGFQFTSWVGPPSDKTKNVIETLALKGYEDLIAPVVVSPSDNTLKFNTEPPFEIPGPPPK